MPAWDAMKGSGNEGSGKGEIVKGSSSEKP
jgi:hypothetical protein